MNALVFPMLVAAAGIAPSLASVPPPIVFDWFEYTGHDAVYAKPLTADFYRNPILAGFHPDPSICRAGEDYYLVNSSFSYFPGIPIFHSRDLVHWQQLGHVITRSSQANFAGLGISRGVFAPAISHHDGVFYVVTTLVDAGGNCFFTANNPAGPWSDPVWLHEVDGIDPSFFFDDDGRAWLVNNGPPPDNRPRYDGHRAIWLQEFDVPTQKLAGPREIIVNGGVDPAKKTTWVEGPHLFKKDGWYYLICAEGGTSEEHSEVVFRSRSVRGPYLPWAKNPILTQRTLDPRRPDPVTCTGHADFVETPAGAWWAVFLGCRPYEGNLYNTGRETFMLPVTWTDNWPAILPPDQPVPVIAAAPGLPVAPSSVIPLNSNFTWRDKFDGPELQPVWNFLRTPPDAWLNLSAHPGALTLQPRDVSLHDRGNPAFIGYRQQHGRFVATTAVHAPTAAGESAGLAAFQNETHYFFLGIRRRDTALQVFLERTTSPDHEEAPQMVAHWEIPAPVPGLVYLKIEADGRAYTFSFGTRPTEWQTLSDHEDGSILSTTVAGGFVGAYVGLHARIDR